MMPDMMKMMDQNQMVKQMVDFQETMLNSSFNAMEIFQVRMEKMMKMFWDQTAWTTEKMSSALIDWTSACNEGMKNVQESSVKINPNLVMIPTKK